MLAQACEGEGEAKVGVKLDRVMAVVS